MQQITISILLAVTLLSCGATPRHGPLSPDQPVKGWNILSSNEADGMAVIAAAREYDINHLELSHHVIHNLREAKDPRRRALVGRFTEAAHKAGIQEVVVWDHALYDLDYYPERFRTGPEGTLDLDQSAFWEWFKQDYRKMLDLVPETDGLVLTFVQAGARAERQYSKQLPTPSEKLAAVVNAVADVVIGERKRNLYVRTFAYTHQEYENIVGAIKRFERPKIRLMMKEAPHDFFLTHPNNFFPGTLPRPTLIEFDATGEFNGQGLIANTWPNYVLKRWSDFLRRNHILGYVARTDRYGDTRIIGRPGEINLLALKRHFEDRTVDAAQVYGEFLQARYPSQATPFLEAAFRNAFDIVTSTLYTLGTNIADHSQLDYDPYNYSYSRHVSGKWHDPPVVFIRHGVNREFHYWRDVVNHLAPAWAKTTEGGQWSEIPWVAEKGWITPGEQMNEEFLGYVITEKNFGLRLAEDSMEQIERARPFLEEADYTDLHHYFYRTLLTVRLHRAVASAYFGFRVYGRGPRFRTPTLTATVRNALKGIPVFAEAIRNYPVKPATGQWNWAEDADKAMVYYNQITRTGWPRVTRGFKNPQGGLTFPLD